MINSKEDLDAIVGTPEHVAFMALLAGTLWRLEKDDAAQAWVAIEDNSTIERFNFSRADFPDALPPALPEYVPVVDPVPEVVSMRQARLALHAAGLLDAVAAEIVSMPGTDGEQARIEWEYAQDIRRDWPVVAAAAGALGLSDEQLDALFRTAAIL